MLAKKIKLEEIIYHNKENFYTVAYGESEEEGLTLVGHISNPARGKTYSVKGVWKEHPSYGEQFSITEYEEEMPTTEEGLVAFLSSGILKGVGVKTALNIVNKFNEDTLEILEFAPQRLAEIRGVSKKKAMEIGTMFMDNKAFSDTMIALQKYGITTTYAMRLYKTYKEETLNVIEENPYKLVDDILGVSFKKADEIARHMGIEENDPFRIESGIRFLLNYFAAEGHTYYPMELFKERAHELLEVSFEEIEENAMNLAMEGILHMEIIEGTQVIFPLPYFYAETGVCKHLIRLKEGGLKPFKFDVDQMITMTEAEENITLADKQREAVKGAMEKGVSLITGGPGTGKTTIIHTIMKIFEMEELKAVIGAPTGRAAKRITESSGFEAKTIHRLLEYQYSEDGTDMTFMKNEENTLECDAVIIDEASMIDILLMNALLKAIKTGTRLIIVGDADQLPSVGAGNVLKDMLKSEMIYSITLDKIFRQAEESMIVVNAHRINKGEYPYYNDRDNDFHFMKRNSETETLETIMDLCAKRLPNYYKECHPLRDIQVLTPTKKGKLGTLHLNTALQALLNPPSDFKNEKTLKNKILREGDKVMQIKNNYMTKWKSLEDFSEGEGVFNGDVGYVRSIDTEDNKVEVAFDGVRIVEYDMSQIDELELAYAITVHKSQGSEYPIVIFPATWAPPMLANRNLLYTGITRAKKNVVIVGFERFLNGMIDNNEPIKRYSGLSYRLKQFNHV